MEEKMIASQGQKYGIGPYSFVGSEKYLLEMTEEMRLLYVELQNVKEGGGSPPGDDPGGPTTD